MEHQTLGRWVVWPIDPATQRIILKIVGFQIKADCFSILAWGYLVPFSKLELLLQIRYKGDLFKIWISPLAFFNVYIMYYVRLWKNLVVTCNKITVNNSMKYFLPFWNGAVCAMRCIAFFCHYLKFISYMVFWPFTTIRIQELVLVRVV